MRIRSEDYEAHDMDFKWRFKNDEVDDGSDESGRPWMKRRKDTDGDRRPREAKGGSVDLPTSRARDQ